MGFGVERQPNRAAEDRSGGEARLTIVVPALDEANRLPPSLKQISEYLQRRPECLPAQVIVVDDGSTDGTADAARGLPTVPGVHLEVAVHERNRGKGAAVRTGFERSIGNRLLLCDADLATPIEELDTLERWFSQRRVVFGSRALDRDLISVHQPVYRDLMGRAFNLAVQLLLLPGIHDTQCGFKLFPGRLGRALANIQRTAGFAYDVELLVLARRWGAELVEVPVRWRHVEASRVRPIHHSSEMLKDVVSLWIRRLVGRLPPPPAPGNG